MSFSETCKSIDYEKRMKGRAKPESRRRCVVKRGWGVNRCPRNRDLKVSGIKGIGTTAKAVLPYVSPDRCNKPSKPSHNAFIFAIVIPSDSLGYLRIRGRDEIWYSSGKHCFLFESIHKHLCPSLPSVDGNIRLLPEMSSMDVRESEVLGKKKNKKVCGYILPTWKLRQ